MNIYSNRLHKLVDNFLGESAFYTEFKGNDASKCKEAVKRAKLATANWPMAW